MEKIKVFVTYAWENEKITRSVLSFVKMLNEKGYDASCDQIKLGEETAPNFTRIMSDGLNSDRVIVILSEKYKEKAGIRGTGVCKEYEIISVDREKPENRGKYIFVSFQSLTEEMLHRILPIMFEGIDIIDLVEDEKNGFQKLFSRLQNVAAVNIGEVGKLELVKPLEIKPFSLKEQEQEFCLGFIVNDGKVSLMPHTKLSIYEWLVEENDTFSIKIQDDELEIIQAQLQKLKKKVMENGHLDSQEDYLYGRLAKQRSIQQKKVQMEQEAIKLLMTSKIILQFWGVKTAETLSKAMCQIIQISRGLVEGKMQTEGYLTQYGKNFSFRAAMPLKEISQVTGTELQFREARIWHFDKEDLEQWIIPAFCLSLVEGNMQYDEELYDLSKYQFGLA